MIEWDYHESETEDWQLPNESWSTYKGLTKLVINYRPYSCPSVFISMMLGDQFASFAFKKDELEGFKRLLSDLCHSRLWPGELDTM